MGASAQARNIEVGMVPATLQVREDESLGIQDRGMLPRASKTP